VKHEVFIKTSDGRRQFVIDDDFCKTLGDRVTFEANTGIVSLFVASWLALLSDSPLNPDDKPYKLYRRFLKRMQDEGLKTLVKGYSSLAHELVSRPTLMGAGSSIGDWIDGFKDTPVFFEYCRYFKTGDPVLLDFLYTFLNFGKKLEFDDESFNSAALRDWFGVEKRLSDHEYCSTDTSSLRKILGAMLPTFTFEDARPKFGPGRVQERGVVGRMGKLRNLPYDSLIDRFFFRGHIGMYGYGEEHGLVVHKIIPDPGRWSPDRELSSRTSLVRFARKNMWIARTICMEPNLLMYFQQAVLREFIRLLDDSPMSSFIDIRDQSRNRSLGLYGSYTGEIDTIDLSAASDSVTVNLVKAIFPPSWVIPMLVTRSDSVILPDGSLKEIVKFAPMGSALCFPTQCIVFVSVCIYAACLRLYESKSVPVSFHDWLTDSVILDVASRFMRKPQFSLTDYQPLAVYGDDICVDRRLTDVVKSILGRLGFVVNEGKSFVGVQAFRETCGGYYLNGYDITPLYFRVKEVRRKLTPRHVASQVNLINAAWNHGYRNLYRFLHNSLMTWESGRRYRNKASTRNAIPYVSDQTSFGIMSRNPRNSHLEHREQPDIKGKPYYQRDEVRALTLSYDTRESGDDLLGVLDSYEYMRWWAGRASSSQPSDKGFTRFDTGGAGLRWRWIPA